MKPMSPIIGYCTNVHAGTDLDSVLRNLETFAEPVRLGLGTDSLGIGLWFSENAVHEALIPSNTERLRASLQRMGLFSYTFNGFPQGDFHSSVVKHRVYRPAWWQSDRAQYTQHLIELLDRLLEPGCSGSISTLPIAWGDPAPSRDQWERAADQLLGVAETLHRLFEQTGRRIVLAIEPEPGCVLTNTAGLRKFFDDYLSPPRIPQEQATRAREYLSLCHDICHAAVMFEDQAVELEACHQAGIHVGKVQVSSAISVVWDNLDTDARAQAVHQLEAFAEDRYLHQTMVRAPDGSFRLHEDLPELLRTGCSHQGEWRIHFHVPIYVEAWGQIQSTQSEITKFLALLLKSPDRFGPVPHLEVETYAWGVLPKPMRVESLDAGIAREIQWLQQELKSAADSI